MKKKIHPLKNLEKQLSSRLIFVGSLLAVFSFAALTYGLIAKEDKNTPIPPEELLASGLETPDLDGTISQTERLRIFGVSGIFAIVASLCLYKAWKTHV